MGNSFELNSRKPLKISVQEELRRYSVIHLIHKEMEVVAQLTYNEKERTFYAFLPGSEQFNHLGDQKIALTSQMVDRLLLRPDGNIELHY